MDNQKKTIKSWLGAGSVNMFGRPFAGKDTQGRLLAESLGGILIAGGDILRSYHDQAKIQQIMAAGGLIPSDFYLGVLLPYLSRAEIAQKPLILSAVGRLQGEEQIITKATDDSGHPIKAVILLNLSEEEVWRRFDEAMLQHDRGNRSDDHKEVLKNRLQKFQTKTEPVIQYYRDKGLIIDVDGTLPRDQVASLIIEKLAQKAQKASS